MRIISSNLTKRQSLNLSWRSTGLNDIRGANPKKGNRISAASMEVLAPRSERRNKNGSAAVVSALLIVYGHLMTLAK